jgi:general stress protein CsbA
MKFLLAIVIAILIAASIFADYKWRKWIADRRRDRQ